MALLVYNHWKEYKFDKLELKNYSVLLQYPGNCSLPNQLQLRDSAGHAIYNASIQRAKALIPAEEDPSVSPPFNAYSGMGNASVRGMYVTQIEVVIRGVLIEGKREVITPLIRHLVYQ